ncbi:MAG: NAD-dependent deacylase [Flavobacteriaceae bacterium]|nr:NAD-dependent deacylase [Flavobacteriaceae bacterium]
MKHIVVLTGAGVSAESGISTFRDSNGLWENHDIMDVATPEGFERNPELVLRFYNQRRKQLFEVEPNKAHLLLAKLEKEYKVTIVTQNVDDLHERSGSTNVIHLHGELRKVRSTYESNLIYDWTEDINLGDLCEKGHQLRPHIVWFGEAVPELERASSFVYDADIVIIIGTSMQVYPAASLIDYAHPKAKIFFIDPRPAISEQRMDNLIVITDLASKGMELLVKEYL